MTLINLQCAVKDIDSQGCIKILNCSDNTVITVHQSCDIETNDNIRVKVSREFEGSSCYVMHGHVYMRSDYESNEPKTYLSCGGLKCKIPKMLEEESYYIIIEKNKTRTRSTPSTRSTRSKR